MKNDYTITKAATLQWYKYVLMESPTRGHMLVRMHILHQKPKLLRVWPKGASWKADTEFIFKLLDMMNADIDRGMEDEK